MKKWYEEEYEFEITVTGFLRSDHTEHYCRNGEEIGDMQAVRSGGNLTLVGGVEPLVKDYVCPDGCVCFRMKAEKTGNENFYKGKFYQE